MPRPRRVEDYPPEFAATIRKAFFNGPIEIEFDDYRKANNFRARLYRYRKDVREALDRDDPPPGRTTLRRGDLMEQWKFLSALTFKVTVNDDDSAVLRIYEAGAADTGIQKMREVL